MKLPFYLNSVSQQVPQLTCTDFSIPAMAYRRADIIKSNLTARETVTKVLFFSNSYRKVLREVGFKCVGMRCLYMRQHKHPYRYALNSESTHEAQTFLYKSQKLHHPCHPLTCAVSYFHRPGFWIRNFSGGSDGSYAPAGSSSPSSVAG